MISALSVDIASLQERLEALESKATKLQKPYDLTKSAPSLALVVKPNEFSQSRKWAQAIGKVIVSVNAFFTVKDQKIEKESFILTLPQDVQFRIFFYLDSNDGLKIVRVCKTWQRWALNNDFWKLRLRSDFPKTCVELIKINANVNWKHIYQISHANKFVKDESYLVTQSIKKLHLVIVAVYSANVLSTLCNEFSSRNESILQYMNEHPGSSREEAIQNLYPSSDCSWDWD